MTQGRTSVLMTHLPEFSPRLDDRLTAEFLELSLELLPLSLRQDAAMLDRAALRFTRLELPRDPDLPLLPPKAYPQLPTALVEAAARSMTPPPAPADVVGRKPELDKAVNALATGRTVAISGPVGAGKTALLRLIAHDPRIKGHFRRVWWLDSLDRAGLRLGLALGAANVLIVPVEDQPRHLRDAVDEPRTLLLVDSTAEMAGGLGWLLECTPHVAVVCQREDAPAGALALALGGVPSDLAANWLSSRTAVSADQARTLAAAVEHNPVALRLLGGLVAEDAVAPEAVLRLLNERIQSLDAVAEPPTQADEQDEAAPEDEADDEADEEAEGDLPEPPPQAPAAPPISRLEILYGMTWDALPPDYQRLLLALSAARRWVAADAAVARFDKPLAGTRALHFLERRGFVERRGDKVQALAPALAVALALANPTSSVGDAVSFPPEPHPADQFDATRTGDTQAVAADTLYARGLTLTEQAQDDEARAALDQALTLRTASRVKYAIAETLVAIGRLAYLRGEDSAAIGHLEDAARHLYELHDDAGLDVVRIALSRVYRRAGRLDAALSVLGDDGPPEDLSMVYRLREEYGKAIAVYQHWLVNCADDGEQHQSARIGLAETYLLAGRYAEALALLEDDHTFEANWLRAVTYHLQGEVNVAAEMYAQLGPESPLEMRAAVARAAARALAVKGEIREAAMLVGAEGVWYEANMARPIFARQRASQALYAHLALMLGQTEEAESSARAAHDVQGERPDLQAEAILCRVLGRLAWESGELAGASHAFDAELTALNSLPNRDEHEIGIALHNLADVQRAMGERERAIANYRRALTHKSAGVEGALTALALADLLAECGRPVEALEAGARAIELLTSQPDADLNAIGHALSLQARRQYEAGRAPRGEAALKEWIARLAARANDGLLHPSTGLQALTIGLYLRSEPPLDDPIPLIDLAERALHLMESEHAGKLPAMAARRDLGVLYARLGRSEEACEVLDPLVSESAAPESNVAALALLTAHHTLARASTRLGDVERALRHFDAAAVLEPDAQAKGMISREAAEVCRESGDDALSAAYYDRALEHLRRERDIQLYTDTVVALGYTRLRLRRFGEAIDTFEEALHVVEGGAHTDQTLKAAVLLDMASAHDTLGQYRRAAETYRRSLAAQDALNEPARYLDTLIALARSEANAGDWQAAVEAYHDTFGFDILDDTRRRTLLAEQGGAYARLGQLQAAINAYDESLTIEGATARERAELHQGLGAIYAKLGTHDQARKHFEAVLSAVQDDRTGQTLKSLADSHRALGQLKEAIEVYHRALGFLERSGTPSERAATERALGEIYLERNQFANSLAHLEAALDLERSLPQHQGGHIVSILQNLARAHEMRGELERATVRHHEALVYQDVRHAPDQYADTLCTLGRLYTSMGRPGEAVRAYEEAGRVEGSQPEPEPARQDAIVAGLAGARRAQGALEAAAELYRQVANSPHRTPARSEAADALTELNAEINRHLKTLEAAEQSLTVLRHSSPPDLAGLVFIRALQARTCHALGRWDISAEHLAEIFEALKTRGGEIRGADPVSKALGALRDAGTAEIAGDPGLAQVAYQEALEAANTDARANASLIWVIRHRMAPNNVRNG